MIFWDEPADWEIGWYWDIPFPGTCVEQSEAASLITKNEMVRPRVSDDTCSTLDLTRDEPRIVMNLPSLIGPHPSPGQ